MNDYAPSAPQLHYGGQSVHNHWSQQLRSKSNWTFTIIYLRNIYILTFTQYVLQQLSIFVAVKCRHRLERRLKKRSNCEQWPDKDKASDADFNRHRQGSQWDIGENNTNPDNMHTYSHTHTNKQPRIHATDNWDNKWDICHVLAMKTERHQAISREQQPIYFLNMIKALTNASLTKLTNRVSQR